MDYYPVFIPQHTALKLSRRRFLGLGAKALLAAGVAGALPACGSTPDPEKATTLLVPEGFVPRIVARSGYQSSANSDYLWHAAPDGGACFDAGDGGWIYVSNSENAVGGVGALRFDANGQVVDSYSMPGGSRRKCSGGPTPWGTWLSCEEVGDGRVWEYDPFNIDPPRAYSSLGLFKHESACVDPLTWQIYMTEDVDGGGLYRFTPASGSTPPRPDLDAGRLEIATISNGVVNWIEIPDPLAASKPTRDQVNGSARFAGGEGIDLYDRYVRFTTKFDNRIWELNLVDDRIRVAYSMRAQLNDVDDITHTPDGGFLVAEDGVQMRVLYVPPAGADPIRLLQLPEHRDSEITGLALDPTATRLYFSSQRGNTGKSEDGISFELQGDFGALDANMKLTEWILDHGDVSI
jgi:hypothetical protein